MVVLAGTAKKPGPKETDQITGDRRVALIAVRSEMAFLSNYLLPGDKQQREREAAIRKRRQTAADSLFRQAQVPERCRHSAPVGKQFARKECPQKRKQAQIAAFRH